MNPFANVHLTPAEQVHYAELGYPTLTAAGLAAHEDAIRAEEREACDAEHERALDDVRAEARDEAIKKVREALDHLE